MPTQINPFESSKLYVVRTCVPPSQLVYSHARVSIPAQPHTVHFTRALIAIGRNTG